LVRVLFYLPVVTPWWFEAIVRPMIFALERDSAVSQIHVMVAPLWRNTGLGEWHLEPMGDLAKVVWHIVDGEHEEAFRRDARQVPGLLEAVSAIDPALTLARSADMVTPMMFPGLVRFVMEGAAPPFATDPTWVVLDHQPFHHGAMPVSVPFALDRLALERGVMRDLWRSQARAGPHGPRVAAPLDGAGRWAGGGLCRCNMRMMRTSFDHAFAGGAEGLVEALVELLPEDVRIALADHPLNTLYVDRQALHECVARHAGRW
jgi:hypothetical protein